jgi:hypothetical protein
MSTAQLAREGPRGLNAEREDRTTVAVFAVVVASVVAALYYAGRAGFDNPARPIVLALGLSLFVSAAPCIVWRLLRRGHYHEPEPWWRSHAALTLWAIGLTAVAGIVAYTTVVNLGAVIAILGYASAVAVLVIWFRQGSQLTNFRFVAFSALFAFWACGVAWSTRYKTPLFWETLEYRGNVHHDPLYNASIATHMATYGVPSTGLDGLPYIPYHYGSGWLIAQWAKLVGADVLSFYTLGPSVVAIPLFFAAVLLLAVEVKKGFAAGTEGADPPLKSDYAAWGFFLAATVGLIPTSGLDAMGIWNLHAMISESYIIGLPVFLLVISTALAYWWRIRSSPSAGDLVFLLGFAPVMLVMTGFLKLSLMLLLLAGGLGVVLLGRLHRNRWVLLSLIISVAVSAVTYRLVSVAAQNQGLVPFAYMRFYANAAWWPYFILTHLLWSWVFIFLRLREENLTTVGDLRRAAAEGRITDVVAVAIVTLAGFLPGELIDIHGGSAIYFSDVQRWLALALLMAYASRWLAERRSRLDAVAGAASLSSRIRVSQLWLAALAVPLVVTVLLNGARAPATALRANLALRRALYAEAGVRASGGFRSLSDPRVLEKGLLQSPDYTLIAALRALDATPVPTKRRTALFIPQSYDRFWKIWGEPERCSFVPLIATATSGLALIDGMPPVGCNLTDQYGMTHYRRRALPQTLGDTTQATLCDKARAKGFSRVVVLDGSPPSGVTTRAIECSTKVSLVPPDVSFGA